MDEHLKIRLLGATVLVALGVIFIPALLDNRGDDRLTVKMEIPDKPTIEIDKPLEDLHARKEALNEIDLPPIPEKTLVNPLDLDADTSTKEVEAVEKIALPNQDKVPSQKSTIGHKVPMKKLEDTALSDDQKTELGKKPQTRQWILQIGSFGQEANANGLVKKLRKANWKAFIETVDGASGKVYRVRLGPVDERKLADNYRQQLVDLGYKHTIIMSHP